MKRIYKDKIINIDDNLFDNKFLFGCLDWIKSGGEVEIIYMSELLKKRKNTELYEKLWDKYAMYSNVYSPKDELDIFEKLFNDVVKNNKKIHIVWITLKEEIEILEKYYTELWFIREEINCFLVDFKIPLVTVSVKIENLIWKWSDYKAQKKDIFFIPPVRESGQNKAMFKWINRGVIAWIYIEKLDEQKEKFLTECVKQEKILPITLARVLKYNLVDIWFEWNIKDLVINY